MYIKDKEMLEAFPDRVQKLYLRLNAIYRSLENLRIKLEARSNMS